MSDVDWRARQKARDAMEVASVESDAFGMAISAMAGKMAAQEIELKYLRAAVKLLATTLKDAGVTNADLLDARLEAAFENAKEEADRTVSLVTCDSCHKHVDRRLSVQTEHGVVCDVCHARNG